MFSSCVGAEPAADVARILDEAQVPNILWGWLAIGLVGQLEMFPVSKILLQDMHYIP